MRVTTQEITMGKFNKKQRDYLDKKELIMELHPRKCENCGKGMSHGYVLHDEITLCTDCLTEHLDIKELAYYTEWEDEDEDVMYTDDGKAFNVSEIKEEV